MRPPRDDASVLAIDESAMPVTAWVPVLLLWTNRFGSLCRMGKRSNITPLEFCMMRRLSLYLPATLLLSAVAIAQPPLPPVISKSFDPTQILVGGLTNLNFMIVNPNTTV